MTIGGLRDFKFVSDASVFIVSLFSENDLGNNFMDTKKNLLAPRVQIPE